MPIKRRSMSALRATAALALIPFATLSLVPAAIAHVDADKPKVEAPAETALELNTRLNAVLSPEEAALKAHVMFLASDPMRGRDSGSNEYDIAAQYVASQYYAAGLRPAGDDGSYLQQVPLLSYRALDKGTLTLTRDGKPQTLEFGTDYIPGANPEKLSTLVDAEFVFAGHGVVAPHLKRNDYKGVDARGKIVVIYAGVGGKFDGEEGAHFGNVNNKIASAAKQGAVGVIVINSPWADGAYKYRLSHWEDAKMSWVDKNGVGFLPAKGVPLLATLSTAGAEKLFGSNPKWKKIAATAADNKSALTGFASKDRLTVALRTEHKVVQSSNVAGIIPGSDPKLKDEVVVLTAHLDHVGVGKAEDGKDNIYNGAMDNAMGVASMIEAAKRFQASGKAPRRTIMFLAVTAEEKGLLGAEYFANNPTVAKDRIVANVNLDMPVITYEFTDMIAFGAARSSLGEIVARATATVGVGVGTDPMPEQGFFVRSDHYRFVQQGVPSVFLWPGMSGTGKDAFNEFLGTRYHQPSDEVTNPDIRWDQGVRFIAANYAIAREIADADQRPAWKKGDFFGTLYNGYGAK